MGPTDDMIHGTAILCSRGSHPEGLIEHRLLAPPLKIAIQQVWGGPEICIFNKFQEMLMLLVQGPCIESHCFVVGKRKGMEVISAEEVRS